MKDISKRVGAYIGSSYLDSGIDSFYGDKKWPAGATWPLAELKLNDKEMALFIGNNSVRIAYQDIAAISVKKTGWVQVTAKQPDQSFGFGLFKINEILTEFKRRGVPAEAINSDNILLAKFVNYGQMFLAITLVLTITILTLRDALR